MSLTPGIIASSLTGHLVTSNFFKIATVTPTSGTSVTFSSIPNTYKSLQVRFSFLTALNGYQVLTSFNGDSSSDYAAHWIYAYGSVTAGAGTTQSSMQSFGFVAGTSTTYPTTGIIDVIDYASTSKYKTVRTFNGMNNNGSAGSTELVLASGLWQSTAAITSLTIATGGTAFATGSTFTLYGIS